MLPEIVATKRALLKRERWLADTLCWTVIEPLSGGLSVLDVIRRLGGDTKAMVPTEVAREAALEFDDERLLGTILQMGAPCVILEDNGYQGSRLEVLRALSANARVHNAYWNTTGHGRLSYAAQGAVLTVVELYDDVQRQGVAPDALDDDLNLVLGPRTDPPSALRAEFLALIESRTAVSLESCLAHPGPTHVLLPAVKADPRPPGALGQVDPELDVQLRLAPAAVRSAELLRLVRSLSDTFGFADEPAVHAACVQIAQGWPDQHQTPGELYRFTYRLQREFQACARTGQAVQDVPEVRRMQAAQAIEAAAMPPGNWPDPLDAFYWASVVYGEEEWRRLRRRLLTTLKGAR